MCCGLSVKTGGQCRPQQPTWAELCTYTLECVLCCRAFDVYVKGLVLSSDLDSRRESQQLIAKLFS